MAGAVSGKFWGVSLVAVLALGACTNGELPGFLKKKDKDDMSDAARAESAVKLVERDVESPDVFQVAEPGLWDGRPSLGGVWVAYPDVKEPERVIIRNEANGKFVIGALFRRERENPGPLIQVSSDAAAALGVLAGAPTGLSVTALRRQKVPDPAAAPARAPQAAEPISQTTLDPIAAAAAAIDEAIETKPEAQETKPTVTASAEPEAKPVRTASLTPAPKRSPLALKKPYIQIGFFSVEGNARKTAESLRKQGILPTIKKQSSKGKTFWRVVVGPANNAPERATIHKKVKAMGFGDAYFVSN